MKTSLLCLFGDPILSKIVETGSVNFTTIEVVDANVSSGYPDIMKCTAKRQEISDTLRHTGKAHIWVISGKKYILMLPIKPEIPEYKRN